MNTQFDKIEEVTGRYLARVVDDPLILDREFSCLNEALASLSNEVAERQRINGCGEGFVYDISDGSLIATVDEDGFVNTSFTALKEVDHVESIDDSETERVKTLLDWHKTTLLSSTALTDIVSAEFTAPSISVTNQADTSEAEGGKCPIVVYMPKAMSPAERVEMLEAPIAGMLAESQLGIVDGGGTWLVGAGASDVWIYTRDVAAVLPLLREKLLQLSCADGTQLQYEDQDVFRFDEILDGTWACGLAQRRQTHGRAFAS